MAFLRIIDGHGAGLSIELTGQRVTIGRDASNLIQIGDPKSSRYHAELTWNTDHYVLVDLESSNGTWNDKGRIASEILRAGSVFRIGATYLRYEDTQKADPSLTVLGEDDGWLDPEHIEGIDQNQPELLSRRRMVDPRVLERTNNYLVLLHQIVLRSDQVDSRDELFELLDDAAADALEGDRCAVFLPTQDGWTLWPTHERRLRARFGATPFARTLLNAVRSRKEPLLCTSTEGGDAADIVPSTSMVQAGVRSAMAAPLRIGNDLHALLYVDRLSGSAGFTRGDLEFLAAVANQLAVRLHNMSHVAELQAEVVRLQAEPSRKTITLLGKDPSMLAVGQFIAKAAPSTSPVLLRGESGTGKELAARSLHQQSQRADKPLQIISCAAMGENQIESALFGHSKGAFLGADQYRPGLFEIADQGTLFLDEVADLPKSAQTKLLRALENGEVQRLGDGATRKVDVRVIAASARDLSEEAAAGRFNADLARRLGILSITIPSLRDRPSDIDLIIDHFLNENAARLEQEAKRCAPEARAVLLRYSWPGNVRQLKQVMERACIMASGKVIMPADLPESLREAPAQTANYSSPLVNLATVEKAHILRVLEHCGGNKKAAAELLEIDRSTLYAKLRQYGEK
jgi:DNA-binding NtrC family response regulator